MKNRYIKSFGVAILLVVTTSVAAQRERVKGSRNVIDVSERLDGFTAIKVTDGLEVTLMADSQTGYDLEMDDNLVELINFDIKDSLLVVSTRKDIRSAKRLNITVRYTALSAVSLDSKSSAFVSTAIEGDIFTGSFLDGSRFNGELKTREADIMANGNSKFEIDYTGDDIRVNLSDNAFAKADINTVKLSIIASGRSDIAFTGNASEATFTVNETAQCKGLSFDADIVQIVGRESGSVTLSVDEKVTLDLSDKSMVQLYGEPKIIVERFSGTARLLKKEL